VLLNNRVGDGEIETGMPAANGVIHARSPQHGVALEKVIGHRTRLETDQSRSKAVLLRQLRIRLQEVQVCLEIIVIIVSIVQLAGDKLIQRRAIGVEPVKQFSLRAPFERDGHREAVDFDMRKTKACKTADVLVAIEIADSPPVLGEEHIIRRPHVRKCRNHDLPRRKDRKRHGGPVA